MTWEGSTAAMPNVPRQTDPEETNMAALDDCYNIFDMREPPKRRLPRGIFEFADRPTEDHLAVTENRACYRDFKLRHQALVYVSALSPKTMLFVNEVSLP